MTRRKTHRILILSVLATLMLLGGFVPALTVRAVYPQVSISEIQGDYWYSPYHGDIVETYGIVTADYQDEEKGGFFLQDPVGDGDPDTSDGIFVYEHWSFDVDVGDEIIIAGEVDEYYSLTELEWVKYVTVLSKGNSLPEPVSLDPPSHNDDSNHRPSV